MKVRFSILQSLHAIVSLPNVTDNGEAVETGSAITQAISYIPYGEVFVEQQAGGWSSPYLFNAKELDSETGLYYYGARYLDPSDAMWLSVDPLWEKYVGMTPYNYCAGNPVKLVDPDGRDIEESSQTEHNRLKADIVAKKQELTNQMKGLDSSSDEYKDLSSRVNKLTEAENNLAAMESSSKIFKYTADSGNSDYAEITQSASNVKNNIYELKYKSGDLGNMIHEIAMHGGQINNGDIYYEIVGDNVITKINNNTSLDNLEISAYQAQYSYMGSSFKTWGDAPEGSQEYIMNQVGAKFGVQINTANSVDSYDDINVNFLKSIYASQYGTEKLYPCTK